MYYPSKTRENTPSMLKQYLYCPVIPWITANYNVREPITDSMAIAREKQKTEGRGQVVVENKKLQLKAVVDELRPDKSGFILIEKKTYKTKHTTRYRQQTIAEALAATPKYRIRYAVLETPGRNYLIEITGTETRQTRTFLEKLWKTITSEKPPPTNPEPQKCRNCWYKRYCPYT